MRWLVGLLAAVLTVCSQVYGQQPIFLPDSRQMDIVERNLVLIYASRKGDKPTVPERSTGFVIKHRGKKIIITVAHVFKGGKNVTAQFFSEKEGYACDLVDYSDELDLMALVPKLPETFPSHVDALELDGNDPLNNRTESVWLYGFVDPVSPTHRIGHTSRKREPADNLRERIEHAVAGQCSPRGDTEIIHHTAASLPGTSGSPLLNAQGRVVGIQSGIQTIPVHLLSGKTTPLIDPTSAYAISAKHLFEKQDTTGGDQDIPRLDLTREPDPTFDKAIAALKLPLQPAFTYVSASDTTVRADDRILVSTCINNGLVSRRASEVIDQYLQEPEAFRKDFGEERLQRYLDGHSLSLITNSAFGISFLIPGKYRVKSQQLEERLGIQLTLAAADQAAGEPSSTMKLLAFTTDEYYAANRQQWDAEIAELVDRFRAENPGRNTDILQGNELKKRLLPEMATHFQEKELGLKDINKNTVVSLADRNKILKKNVLPDASSNRTDRFGILNLWYRVNYIDERTGEVQAVHCGSWGNVAIIASYRCSKQDLDAFADDRKPSRYFLDQRIIRSSLSFY